MGSATPAFQFFPFSAAGEVAEGVKADALIVPVYKHGDSLAASPLLTALDKALRGMILATAKEEKYDGSRGKLLVFRKTPGDAVTARRVILMGLGEPGKAGLDKLENASVAAIGAALALDGMASLAIALPDAPSPETVVTLVDAVYQATYVSQESKKPSPSVRKVLLVCAKKPSAALNEALALGQAMAGARAFAKDLVNRPSNLKTTQTLVDAALSLKKAGLSVKVQDDAAWIEKHMPAFFEVARGAVASDPPKFITVRYTPDKKARKKLALVGKSVIFDTGGYQVKPGDFMNTMKGDMTGGAVVLAVMKALAELKPAVAVTATLAATANKIDSHAMLPDAIVETTCGKRVEIRHTDAEGRLTLIDAVAQACGKPAGKGKGSGKKAEQDPGTDKPDAPDAMVTIATLTGSASRAVGRAIALMGNDRTWEGRVEQAARALGEPIQALEVIEQDYEDIKSKLDGADIINTSRNKNRGAQSAAAFVMSGAPEGLPMAHLDIAGADMTDDEKATGIGVKTLVRLVLDVAGG